MEHALPLTPHQANIDVARADVYAAKGDLEQAVLLYEQALILDPEHVASLVGLGRIQVQKEENDMALNRLCTALQHDPTHHQASGVAAVNCSGRLTAVCALRLPFSCPKCTKTTARAIQLLS